MCSSKINEIDAYKFYIVSFDNENDLLEKSFYLKNAVKKISLNGRKKVRKRLFSIKNSYKK